ncbi:MAG: type 4a pilus biogenesis protein PilO [Deltaproteobacteria bacterium]|nr:type 4a pilus biogenesis protein PilO [Deltaproteobacteria bacterium]
METEYEKLDSKLQTLKIKARKLKQLQADLNAAEDKFKIARRALPDQKDIPSLLAAISNSGQESGLNFLLFQPAGVKTKDFYAEIPITLNVEGSYHEVVVFFDRVARLPRIVNISNLRMGQTAGATMLSASLTASTYQFVEKPPEPPKTKKKKKKKKK